ncbi:MAG: DUF488 domain-containing protein [Sulfurimonas sp.]|jgi:uncharacterized protein (DUF488 family)|uniref:DUF488 domain-containing protein n=1 Tax=Sulfurimonas sp. TaxID=2022749 RepID=UPI003569B06E
MNLFTIGYTQKSAEEFFTLLTKNGVKKLIDIRLNNTSQLAGFANAKHLPYLLKLHNIEYEYKTEFAPTKELLKGYQDENIDWEEYEKQYNQILIDRDIFFNTSLSEFEDAVLLCSEPTAEQCHRRLAAEYIEKHFENVNIKHL